MTSLREITVAEQSNSLKVLISRYEVQTARQLISAFNSKTEYSYLGYTVKRNDSSISILSNNESTNIEIGNTKLTPEQREQALEKIWEGIKQFFKDHAQDIESGKITAADIGGALYGVTASVILVIFAPFAAVGPLAKVVAAPFIALAAQKGRYWGASVDELIKIINDESDLNKQEIAGVLATVFVTASYVPGVGAIIQLGGIDAWNLTVEVGKKLGGTVVEIIGGIVSVVGDIGEGVGGAIVDVVDDLLDLF
ncbi:MAG: hypothetical protein IPI97_01260 [Nitrosomonas sp.]|nr:hypothetical protein [Nitrosomonas sp.]MBK7363683.1 hypothetical protein [Nitrosomonas sp.]